ncbi:RAMP superfamily CRISPR-associated protein [Campylobacter geochelonis]|uniref:RAMP superfamily CRISPR-associated protein n=1 Tax=Campylobacter geochelonis TaxID=1780362 RepID=UPI00077092CC|nr:RAMP superfamily CRISPR-associated protein [Campylobacter geochelonis]CZE46254.1 CRISPR-associated RAMP protein [Campylobacter geochelonis]
MQKQLEITLKSNALISNGDGYGLVDVDSISDEFGRFYIPAKRLKGVLKESATEVLEMQGKLDDEIKNQINKLFGTSKEKGKISIENAIIDESEFLKRLSIFGKERVKSLKSMVINQTSIDENGVAKSGSLRRMRVIKSGNKFSAKIELEEDLEDKFKELLNHAIKNLKRLGSSRNRGLGAVECELVPIKDSKKSLNFNLKNSCIVINLTQPTAITLKKGDDFNTQTYDHLPSTTLKGAILAKLRSIKKDDLADEFEKAIVKNGYLFKDNKIYRPTPNILEKYKYENSNEALDKFSTTNGKEPEAKCSKLGGFFYADGKTIELIKPKKESFFHIQRSRISQSSDKENGAIFTYESLCRDQSFCAEILCESTLLEKVKTALGSEFALQIGRSKNAQYSKTQAFINVVNKSKEQNLKSKAYLVCESPLILLDEFGVQSPTLANLKLYIDSLLECDCEIVKSSARFSRQQSYKLSYKCKVKETLGFESASTFLIDFKKKCDISKLEKGLGELVEFGYGQVRVYDEFKDFEFINLNDKEKSSIIEEVFDNQKELLFKLLEEYFYEKMCLNGFKEIAVKDENITSSEYSRLEKIVSSSSKQKDLKDKLEAKKENNTNELTTFNQKIKNKFIQINDWFDKIPEFDSVKDKISENLYNEFVDSRGYELQKRFLISLIRYHRNVKKDVK